MEKVIVGVGSVNPVKVRGARIAFSRYMNAVVKPVEVDPRVPPQPVGFRQLIIGGVNRAVGALKAIDADYGVGIEAGPLRIDKDLGLEVQVAVIVDKGLRVSMGTSAGFLLPSIVAREVLGGRELGEVFPIKRGHDLGEGIGVIGVLSMGLTTRQDLTVQAVEAALLPFINESLYKLPAIDEIIEGLPE